MYDKNWIYLQTCFEDTNNLHQGTNNDYFSSKIKIDKYFIFWLIDMKSLIVSKILVLENFTWNWCIYVDK